MHPLQYGTEAELPERVPLRAGPLTLLYEAGHLRYVRLGDREIVRMVYAAVRDPNWLTVPGRIENEKREIRPDAFRISYEGHYEDGPLRFRARYVLEGSPSGQITCRMEGEALTAFRKNRIGFCVHHPVREMMGVACTVTHPDGTTSQAAFPEPVSPHQPFRNIREMAWPVAGGCRARLRFAGDVFETEDQRNWTDGSYKTYCTPLERPFPVAVAAGESVRQEITLTLEGTRATAGAAAGPPVFALRPGAGTPFPAVGIGHAAEGPGLGPPEAAWLQALHLHHYRADVPLHAPGWEAGFARAVAEARKLALPLEVALFFGADPAAEADAFAQQCRQEAVPLAALLVLHRDHKATPPQLPAAVVPRLRRAAGDPVPIGGGTDAFFAELNRSRPAAPELDFVSFSINPQVHATDALSLVENLEAQAFAVETARGFADGRPVAVGPVTLKRRYNPDATGEQPATPPGALPWNVDARQPSLFAAAWTLGSLAYLAGSGAARLTYYETTGLRGVLPGASSPAPPAAFRATPGTVYPVYLLLREVLGFSPVRILPTGSSQPLSCAGMVLENGSGKRKLLLTNLTNDALRIRNEAPGNWTRRKVLDAGTYGQFAAHPDGFDAPGAWGAVGAEGTDWLEVGPLATVVLVE
jgi:hypothetical protein